MIKTDSPLFDSIRVKPAQDRRVRSAPAEACEWPGCQEPGPHRAPKGRDQEKQYWRFCQQHAREYNQSYNYFKGMTADAIAQWQRDSIIGHRPTWKMGQNSSLNGQGGRSGGARLHREAEDPFGLFGKAAHQARKQEETKEQRAVRNAERKALETMDLEPGATKEQVKSQFKILAKRHHPDVNGGDRSTEDRLREIIRAYNYLKTVGYR